MTDPAPAVRRNFGGFLVSCLLDWPVLWSVVGFLAGFFVAGGIPCIGWNAMELIIAQHIIDHGVYAMSVDFPSAITWRPVFPTFVVTFFRLWTDDPLLIYQCIYGLSIASLTASLFGAARLLWGRLAALTAALLVLACRGLTAYLVTHTHSYSHVVGLMVLGPALWLSALLFRRLETAPPSLWWYAATGAAWSLAYLCRSELLLFAGWCGIILTWLHWRRRYSWRPLAAYAAAFAVGFIGYNIPAARSAERDGLLIRKTIYGFYTSEGWLTINSDIRGDIEAIGYERAIAKYGDPVADHESLLVAIRNNPRALAERMHANAVAFYGLLTNRDFLLPLWLGLAGAGLLLGLTRKVHAGSRPALLFLLGTFAAAHFVLIFHIDPRYVTIALPTLLLFVAFTVHAVASFKHGLLFGVALAIAVIFPERSYLHDLLLKPPARQTFGTDALRACGEHFRATVPHPELTQNREPHVVFILPASPGMRAEEQFLMPYFAHTGWTNGGANGVFPRGRIYSYREVPIDYTYMPLADAKAQGKPILAELEPPGIGRYALIRGN